MDAGERIRHPRGICGRFRTLLEIGAGYADIVF
jgi:hypothetical protein